MTSKQGRLEDLEKRFSQQESQLAESPEKETLSILHAMIQENRRQILELSNSSKSSDDQSFDRIANLYKSAPGMEGAAENSGLPIGSKAPDFTLPDSSGKLLSLKDYRGKNVVLVFYPLDWSPACSDQLSLYQSELEEFSKYNAQVVAVSVDSFYSHGAWSAVRGITFPLLADFNPKGGVAKLYKVWRETNGFSERALYIIDSAGIIRSCTIAPEIYKIPDVYELFDQLKAIQK
jgi:peroxiredoxin